MGSRFGRKVYTRMTDGARVRCDYCGYKFKIKNHFLPGSVLILCKKCRKPQNEQGGSNGRPPILSDL